MKSPEAVTSSTSVWVTVVDPATEDGRDAITHWDQGHASQWSVPADAAHDDLVLAWLTGGTGFRYLLRIISPPIAAASAEYAGPQQADLLPVEPIQPSIPMARLKGDPQLRRWWLVRYNMQGVARAQHEGLARDAEWPEFLRLLESSAPKAAAVLRQSAAGPVPSPQEPRGEQPFDDIVFTDDQETHTHVIVARDLGDLIARATAINDKRGSFDISFSSLLLGVFCSDDALGKWLRTYIAQQHVRIDHALSKVGKDAATASAAAGRGLKERDVLLAVPLRRTVSARQALDEASRIADGQSIRPEAVHLMAAMIGLADYHKDDLSAMSLDRPRWAAAFVQHVASQTSDAAEIAFWQRYYTRRFPGHDLPPLKPRAYQGRRPDYDADAYTSTDLLAIDDEVSALASVIASKQTKPPLAIGLFGDWGSGKTFFMKHLRRRIEQICAGARQQKPEERECLGHVAQIEFNAWHYQEGDLWASLVDHLLRNLRFGEDEDETRVAERRNEIVRQLDETESRQQAAADQAAAVDQKVNEAEARVTQLKHDEDVARAQLARELSASQLFAAVRATFTMDPATRQEAEDLARRLNIPAAARTAVELRDAIDDAKRELHGVQALFVPLVRSENRRTRVVYLAIALLAPTLGALAVYTLLAQQDVILRLSTIIGGAVAFVGSTAAWIKQQAQWVGDMRRSIEPIAQKVNRAVDDAIEEAVSEQKKAVEAKLAELDALRREQTAAQKQRDDLAAQSAALKASLAVLGDDGLMRAFLDDRIGGGVYQQKLGIAALVRRDFERLSRKIEQVTEREASNKLRDNELVINRIVLYIDDLDRCEMEKVVPVLRAVHLLLAFPAFVVVVGVDSRWVARCLQEHMEKIFAADGGNRQTVTPLDYLEKIFQIPIWLEPVTPDRRVYMARKLLRKPIPPRVKTASAPAVVTGIEAPERKRAGDAPQAEAHSAEETSHAASAEDTANETDVEIAHDAPIDLNPPGLNISDGEYAFLGDLGGLLSASPRVIKRFVNTYRLINVTMAQTGVQDPDRHPHDAHIRMLLLAILVDMPDLSRALQEALHETNGTNLAITPLMQVMDKRYDPTLDRSADRQREQEQWQQVRQWMEDRGEPWSSVPAARFWEWLTPVGRYTFNLSREKYVARDQTAPDTTQGAMA